MDSSLFHLHDLDIPLARIPKKRLVHYTTSWFKILMAMGILLYNFMALFNNFHYFQNYLESAKATEPSPTSADEKDTPTQITNKRDRNTLNDNPLFEVSLPTYDDAPADL